MQTKRFKHNQCRKKLPLQNEQLFYIASMALNTTDHNWAQLQIWTASRKHQSQTKKSGSNMQVNIWVSDKHARLAS
jgi:hypothetical protein